MFIRTPRPLDSLQAIPWKNGGGTTRTLASTPEGASLDTFVWRLSLADVASSGPFSLFPEIDRTIVLWRGSGMTLAGSTGSHALTTLFEPYSFPGEDSIDATLIDGPTVDLNVMTRRGHATSTTTSHQAASSFEQVADEVFFVCGSGAWALQVADGREYVLQAGEFLQISDVQAPVRFRTTSVVSAPHVLLIAAISRT